MDHENPGGGPNDENEWDRVAEIEDTMHNFMADVYNMRDEEDAALAQDLSACRAAEKWETGVYPPWTTMEINLDKCVRRSPPPSPPPSVTPAPQPQRARAVQGHPANLAPEDEARHVHVLPRLVRALGRRQGALAQAVPQEELGFSAR